MFSFTALTTLLFKTDAATGFFITGVVGGFTVCLIADLAGFPLV